LAAAQLLLAVAGQDVASEGTRVTPGLRRRQVALVISCPLFVIAYLGWSMADEPLVYLRYRAAGTSEPLWVDADMVITACLPIVAVGLIAGALVVALLGARHQRTWAAAGNVVASAIVVIGPAAAVAGRVDSAPAHPELDLLALAFGVLVGIVVLAIAAAGRSLIAAQPGSWSSHPRYSASCYRPHSSQ
jgi:hypothetical protein